MKKKQQTLCYEGEGCANFKNPILCSDCERNFDNFNIQDRFRYADEIPRIDKQKLTCDKAKEPPCHLEPSSELCGKCELNKSKENTTP